MDLVIDRGSLKLVSGFSFSVSSPSGMSVLISRGIILNKSVGEVRSEIWLQIAINNNIIKVTIMKIVTIMQ